MLEASHQSTLQPLLAALALPDEALVGQRIPKKMLLEQGAPTAADRRLVQDGIEEMTWVAALKPFIVGTPAYADAEREYAEIAVLSAELRRGARRARLLELIHRAIPYPIVLAIEHEGMVALSLAPKRRSEAEADRVVVEEVHTTEGVCVSEATPLGKAFLASLALAKQPHSHFHALYQGWIGCVAALAAARITGEYVRSTSPERTAIRRAALDELERIDKEVTRLRGRAVKEKQLNRQVELNLEIRRLEGRIQQLRAEL